ncbi:hypothetical protein Tco_1015845 [Tanacetum coccineum]|uniref:Uncharacterized protein n=1 Tax=Tanacetum coccineum TaxID=301880 RepID=A0ABQ5FN81_9ASTR
MSSPGASSAGPSTPQSYSSGPSIPPSYSSGPSTPPNYSPGSSRNAECSNCKHLRGKISVLKATMDMHMHPEQHTVNSAALLHEVLNEMKKLDLETEHDKMNICPNIELFKKLKYKFEMVENEQIEKKFIFSYGIGDIKMEAKEGNFVIPNVHYMLEVTLNVLSHDLLEEQGYVVEISNNKCNIQYMFRRKGKGNAHEEKLHEKMMALGERCYHNTHQVLLINISSHRTQR